MESDASEFERPTEPVLPDGCPEIVFNLADRFQRLHAGGEIETQPAAIFSGQLRTNIQIRPTGKVRLFGVRFHPAGASLFAGFHLAELTDRIVSLDSVFGHSAGLIEEMIAEASTFEDRVSLFEKVLLGLLPMRREIDPIAEAASKMIVAKGGREPVRQIAGLFGVSERRLERKFDRSIGLSPKLFSRIARFQNIVRHIGLSGTPDFLDAALSFGYYDQSHMIRDFNEFAGTSPLNFFDDTHRISELFTAAA